MQRNSETRSVISGQQSIRSLEVGFAGSAEAAATGNRGAGGNVGGAAQAAADDLNPSAAGAATAPGQSGEHGPPEKDPVSAATNTDKPGKSGRVTIVITRPPTP